MLSDILELKRSLEEDSCVPPFDWEIVESLVGVLKHVAFLNEKMQEEQYLMGDFFRDLVLCRESLEKLLPNEKGAKLLRALEVNTRSLFSSDHFCASIVCDPRFNFENSIALNALHRRDAIVSILTLSLEFCFLINPFLRKWVENDPLF